MPGGSNSLRPSSRNWRYGRAAKSTAPAAKRSRFQADLRCNSPPGMGLS